MNPNSLAKWAAGAACIGMLLPPSALAVEPMPLPGTAPHVTGAPAVTPPEIAPHIIGPTDVALRPGGVVVGQVVNQQGVVQAGVPVSIQFETHEVARTTTDANGVFAAQGLRGGQYRLVTSDGMTVCRLWAPNTAPPAARPAALIVAGNSAVRGQWSGGPMGDWIGWVKAHPYITAGVVAGAIAVPLAFADDDDPPGS